MRDRLIYSRQFSIAEMHACAEAERRYAATCAEGSLRRLDALDRAACLDLRAAQLADLEKPLAERGKVGA